METINRFLKNAALDIFFKSVRIKRELFNFLTSEMLSPWTSKFTDWLLSSSDGVRGGGAAGGGGGSSPFSSPVKVKKGFLKWDLDHDGS